MSARLNDAVRELLVRIEGGAAHDVPAATLDELRVALTESVAAEPAAPAPAPTETDRMVDLIRGVLANPQAWRRLAESADARVRNQKYRPAWLLAEAVRYAEERARNLAGVLLLDRQERDAAVDELLAVTQHVAERLTRMADAAPLYAALARVRGQR